MADIDVPGGYDGHVVYPLCGLDVHKQTVVAAVRVPELKKKRGWQVITQTFGTMTADLLALSDWLLIQG